MTAVFPLCRWSSPGTTVSASATRRIGVVQSLSGYYVAPAYGQMFYFLVFLLVMIFRPNGLLGQRGAAMVGINE